MGFTIGSAFMFEKISIHKRLVTSGTNEAFWVPLGVQGRNVIVGNGMRAPRAFGRKHAKITILAIGLIVFFVKSIFAEIFTAVKTDETSWMPVFVQG